MAARQRLTLALLLASSSTTLGSANACCLTDWLYGRTPAYAVTAPAPVTLGYAPTLSAPAPYSAGFAPLTSQPNLLPLAGTSIYGQSNSYAVQRPAYGTVPLNNPSVYTGLPVVNGYRGAAGTSGGFYGTGNVYPNNYAAASPSLAPVTSLRPDLAASSTVALPINRNQRFATPIRSGLSRFFSSLLGTGYRSSYYTAPITYYRPATTIDPITGTTVTTQQACSSTVQQLQRTPFSSAFAGSPAVTTPGYNQSCATGSCGSIGQLNQGSQFSPDMQPIGPPTLSTSGYDSPNYATPGSIAPSTYLAPAQVSPNTNLAPLTGSDRGPNTGYLSSPSDRQPIEAPSLRSSRPAYDESLYSQDDSYSRNNRVRDEEATFDAYRRGYEAGRATQESQSSRSDAGQLDESTPSSQYRYRLESPPKDPAPASTPSNTEPNESSSNALDQYLSRRSNTNQDTRATLYAGREFQPANGLQPKNQQPQYRAPVRPIPAPQDYRNPFDTVETSNTVNRFNTTRQPDDLDSNIAAPPWRSAPTTRDDSPGLSAPDLLPALPEPAKQFRSMNPAAAAPMTRWNTPVREASARSLRSSQLVPARPDSKPISKTSSSWYSLKK